MMWMFYPKSTAKYIRKKGKKNLWVNFVLGGENYIVVLPVKRGVRAIQKISCDGKDETCKMMEFLGPNNDFFGQKLCPSDFGYENIEIEMLVPEKTLLFSCNEIILL